MSAAKPGMRMSAYRLWASLLALWYHAKGERYQGPGYAANAKRKVRRSLTDLGESFACGWKEMQDGRYANALMVYAATIGEFHPLKPVIDNYLERDPGMPIVILSGQLQYIDALRAAYPAAAVGTPPLCAPWLYDRLFELVRPRALALGEGPCRHLHFPIPFDLALPAACVRHGTPMIVVNATLHRYLVASKTDYIEARLFGGIFDDALRYWYTPNEIFKSWLLKGRIPEDRIVVTGDLRFDGLRALGDRSSEFAEVLAVLRGTEAPVIVAGSVNAIDEEGPVVDGWLEVRRQHPGARLVMAPRHINNQENMRKLYDYLEAKGVRYARRSEGIARMRETEALVVDVFGELPHYYSVASAAYIGRNHGVLEPLRFEVPTVVAPRSDWAAEYVTFPAYQMMVDEKGIIEAPDKTQLGSIFLKIVEVPDYGRSFVENALRIAARQRGAGRRIVEHIESRVR